jgi:DNA mismatch repair protein MutL
MQLIKVLSEDTINKIAAGEVIENPASVVKELVENALDGGAKHLTVEIKGGGFQLIKISDDGIGMSADDAILCFERHATSKISHIDDLSSLNSMGFRGEALASIAAIARIDLTTALQDGQGTHIEVEGGKIGSVHPAPRKQGTTFEVRSLFYNVPARKKFQKQPSSASAEVHKLLISLALAHPEIGFEFISNEETLLKVAPATLEKRIADIFQGSFLTSKLKLSGEDRGYILQGFAGMPEDHRINRTGQYLFVNRRPIFSPQVAYAVKDGYGERLSVDRYPVFVMHLTVPPSLIDVNVHPQKKEVRFQESEFIRQFIQRHVHQAFGSSISRPEVKTLEVQTWDAPLVFREEPFDTGPSIFTPQEQVIGLFEHYLLLDASTVEGYQPGILWVDLQKAQQALIWNTLTKPQPEPLAQGLLIPLPIELTAVEAQEFSRRASDLNRIGFSLQQSGKHHLLVEAIPPFLDETDALEAVRLILGSEEPFVQLSEKIAHFAVRRKKTFMLQEALALWRSFKTIKSPEGVTWTGKHDIENLFK